MKCNLLFFFPSVIVFFFRFFKDRLGNLIIAYKRKFRCVCVLFCEVVVLYCIVLSSLFLLHTVFVIVFSVEKEREREREREKRKKKEKGKEREKIKSSSLSSCFLCIDFSFHSYIFLATKRKLLKKKCLILHFFFVDC